MVGVGRCFFRCEGVINIPAVECPDASNDTSPYERVRALQFLIPQRPSPSWNLQGTIASEVRVSCTELGPQ